LNIVQVGAYPPPFGGVSVHLGRLHERLRAAGLESTVIDLSGIPKPAPGVRSRTWPDAVAELSAAPSACVHFHNFEPGNAPAYERLARRHLTVLSLHDERFEAEIDRLGALRRRVTLSRLRRVHAVVVDNRRCLAIARRLWGDAALIRLVPEFIPPAEVPPLEEPAVLELRARCRFLLASTAWSVCFDAAGNDLYGLDLLVETLGRLAVEHGLDVGLVLLIPGGEHPYLDALRHRLRQLGVEGRSLLLTRPIPEASSLWKSADVVIRATTTDGNALTICEALALGVPVVASDCVERPPGTVLFRSRDGADLAERVATLLADPPAARRRTAALEIPDNAAALVELYRDLAERRAAHAV
jgi:glycosyltransferase involved in cell wall biosynthesis